MKLFPEMVGLETEPHMLNDHGLSWDWQAYVSDPCAAGLIETHNMLHYFLKEKWNHKHEKRGE